MSEKNNMKKIMELTLVFTLIIAGTFAAVSAASTTKQTSSVNILKPSVKPVPAIRLGDMNLDGKVDFGDINPFTLALYHPLDYIRIYGINPVIPGDCNHDGRFNSMDVNAFVALLSK